MLNDESPCRARQRLWLVTTALWFPMTTSTFKIPGADNQPIIGNTHLPTGDPAGVGIIAHGFKGYKDYGMFPCVAATLAEAGFIAHRFNFSHSGMTNQTDTFEKPELFENDTWNKQVDDLTAIVKAINTEKLAGSGLPLFMFGHSRGGASTLLFAARTAGDKLIPNAHGIITVAAPADLNRLPDKQLEKLQTQGFLESPSSRTRQRLRIGRHWLDEQLADPTGHDLLAQVQNITSPILIVHGSDDETVPVTDAQRIADAAANAEVNMKIIDEGNHVMNIPNPFADDATVSPQLQQLLDKTIQFIQSHVHQR